jgi:TP901 family phage tail tape measure protein
MSFKQDDVQLNVKVAGNPARKALADLDMDAQKLRNSMRGVKKSTEEYAEKAKALKEIENRMAETRKQIGLTNMSLRELNNEARRLRGMKQHLDPTTEAFKNVDSELKKVNGRIKEVNTGLTPFQASWKEMKKNILGVGAGIAAVFAGNAIMNYFSNAISGAAKLSDQISDIQKTTKMTKEEVELLNSELGKIDTRTSMSDLRDIAIVAGQFGVAKEQIKGFVEWIDKTSVALGDEFAGGAREVATEMSKLRNVLTDIKSEDIGTDIGFISNAINELGAAGVATGPVITDYANRIGGYGIQIGLTSGQVLGLSATMQELSISTERGGTAIVKILQKMLTNTETFAKIAGMELGDFEKLLNTNIYGAFKKVVEGSQGAAKNSVEFGKIVEELELQGAGASEVFAKLGSNMEMLEEKTELANTGLTNTTSITEEFKIKNENLAGSLEKLNKSWNKLTTNSTVQKFFSGMVEIANDSVRSLEKWLDSWSRFWTGLTTGDEYTLMEKLQFRNAADKKAFDEKIALEIAQYKQLNTIQLAALVEKKENELRAHLEEYENLKKYGGQASVAAHGKVMQIANIELKAARDILAKRTDIEKGGLAAKRKLTEKELKDIEKHEKDKAKIIEDAAKEAERKKKEQQQQEIDTLNGYYDKQKLELLGLFADLVTERETYERAEAIVEYNRLQALLAYQKEHNISTLKTEEDLYKQKIALREKYATNPDGSYNVEKPKDSSSSKPEKAKDIKEEKTEEQKFEESAAKKEYDETIRYVNATNDVVKAGFDFVEAREARELSNFKKAQDEKRKALDERLKNNLISESEYRTTVGQLDEEYDAKKKKIQRNQAIRNKILALIDVQVNTAAGVVEAAPDPALMAMVGIAGRIATAAILMQPIPELRKGTKRLVGPSHDNPSRGLDIVNNSTGQVVARAEGDEVLVSRASAEANKPIIDALIDNPGKPINIAYGMAPTNYGYVRSFSAPSGGGRQVVNTTNNYHNGGETNVKGLEMRLDRLVTQVEDLTSVMSQKGDSKIYLGEIRKAEKELADLERIARV